MPKHTREELKALMLDSDTNDEGLSEMFLDIRDTLLEIKEILSGENL